MIFRRHTAQDFEQIAALRWSLKTEDAPPGALPDRQDFSETYLALLRDQHRLGQTVHWVLETPKRVEGVMTLRLIAKETSLDGRNRKWGYLTNVFVTKPLRGKGLGGTLLRKVIGHAKDSNLEFLLVWPSDASLTFYRRAGFAGSGDPLVLELD